MEVLQADRIWFFIFLALPGLIGGFAWEFLVPAAERKAPEQILRGVTFSIVNAGLVWPLVELIDASAPRWVVRLTAVLILVVLPVAEAFALRALLESGWFRSVGRLRHPVPKPWDYFFGQGHSCWVIMHMKSGRRVAGYFGAESFASSFPHPEQIYVQELWAVDDEDDRRLDHRVPRTQGALVSLADCDSIEFFTDEPEAK